MTFLRPQRLQARRAEEDAGEGDGGEDEPPEPDLLDGLRLDQRIYERTAEDAVGEDDEVVQEPGAGRPDERLPVVPQHQLVRDALLDGAAAVQLRVEHLDAEVEDGQRQQDADAEGDAPHRVDVRHGVAGGGVDDQVHDDDDHAAGAQREVGDEDEDRAALLERVLVRGLGGGRGRGRVLAAGAEADDAAGDG